MAQSSNKPPHRRLFATKRLGRSAVSNGSALLAGIDGRLQIARRYRDIMRAVEADQGGEGLSEARMQLVRRFAACACLAEELEAQLLSGEKIDIDQHGKLVSSLVRIARRIGIDRIPRNVTPNLDQYLERQREWERD